MNSFLLFFRLYHNYKRFIKSNSAPKLNWMQFLIFDSLKHSLKFLRKGNNLMIIAQKLKKYIETTPKSESWIPPMLM